MSELAKDLDLLLTRDLATFRREVALFPDDATLWQTLPGVTNSAGCLGLHVAGNLAHFVGTVLGGTSYVRDRDAEFRPREGGRGAVDAELVRAEEVVRAVLPALSDHALEQPYPVAVGGVQPTTRLFLLHLATHLAWHLGQASYLRRLLTRDGRGSDALSVKALGERSAR